MKNLVKCSEYWKTLLYLPFFSKFRTRLQFTTLGNNIHSSKMSEISRKKVGFFFKYKWPFSSLANPLLRNFRSSRSEVFCKNAVFKNFAKFTGKHLCQYLFLNKVACLSLEVFKKETLAQVFSSKFFKFCKNTTLFIEHLWWLLLKFCYAEAAWKHYSYIVNLHFVIYKYIIANHGKTSITM